MTRQPASTEEHRDEPSDEHAGLDRRAGCRPDPSALLGTGVISLPSLAAGIAGPSSLVAWVALVVLSVPLAGTFAALGPRHPDGGRCLDLCAQAFGARAAVVVGWCFYFAIPVGAPPAAMFAGGYVADAIGGGRATAVVTAGVLDCKSATVLGHIRTLVRLCWWWPTRPPHF